MRVKVGRNKNRRISAEKAYNFINETVTKYDWEQQMIMSVPNINNYSLRTQIGGPLQVLFLGVSLCLSVEKFKPYEDTILKSTSVEEERTYIKTIQRHFFALNLFAICNPFFIVYVIVSDDGSTMKAVLKHTLIGV